MYLHVSHLLELARDNSVIVHNVEIEPWKTGIRIWDRGNAGGDRNVHVHSGRDIYRPRFRSGSQGFTYRGSTSGSGTQTQPNYTTSGPKIM
jgi:hypothetical protein